MGYKIEKGQVIILLFFFMLPVYLRIWSWPPQTRTWIVFFGNLFQKILLDFFHPLALNHMKRTSFITMATGNTVAGFFDDLRICRPSIFVGQIIGSKMYLQIDLIPSSGQRFSAGGKCIGMAGCQIPASRAVWIVWMISSSLASPMTAEPIA